MPLRIVGFAGSLSRPSRTRARVDLVMAATPEDLGGLPRVIVASILSAEALVVEGPVYKGSHAGPFKHLFDLIEPAALSGKPVLLTATGGGDRHAPVIKHQLHPLFGFFESVPLPTGVRASGADVIDGVPASPALLARIDRAISQFPRTLNQLPAATVA